MLPFSLLNDEQMSNWVGVEALVSLEKKEKTTQLFHQKHPWFCVVLGLLVAGRFFVVSEHSLKLVNILLMAEIRLTTWDV